MLDCFYYSDSNSHSHSWCIYTHPHLLAFLRFSASLYIPASLLYSEEGHNYEKLYCSYVRQCWHSKATCDRESYATTVVRTYSSSGLLRSPTTLAATTFELVSIARRRSTVVLAHRICLRRADRVLAIVSLVSSFIRYSNGKAQGRDFGAVEALDNSMLGSSTQSKRVQQEHRRRDMAITRERT